MKAQHPPQAQLENAIRSVDRRVAPLATNSCPLVSVNKCVRLGNAVGVGGCTFELARRRHTASLFTGALQRAREAGRHLAAPMRLRGAQFGDRG